MQPLPLTRAFTLVEPGPVILLTTHDGQKDNIMVLTWSMVLDFTPQFAICTGPWNWSWRALVDSKECVLAIPGADLLDTAIGIGTCSGREVDKFVRFGLTRQPASEVKAPLIGECLGQVECRVREVLQPSGIVVLDGLAAWHDPTRTDQRRLHAVGDGSFTADGERFDRHEAMKAKLPDGI